MCAGGGATRSIERHKTHSRVHYRSILTTQYKRTSSPPHILQLLISLYQSFPLLQASTIPQSLPHIHPRPTRPHPPILSHHFTNPHHRCSPTSSTTASNPASTTSPPNPSCPARPAACSAACPSSWPAASASGSASRSSRRRWWASLGRGDRRDAWIIIIKTRSLEKETEERGGECVSSWLVCWSGYYYGTGFFTAGWLAWGVIIVVLLLYCKIWGVNYIR